TRKRAGALPPPALMSFAWSRRTSEAGSGLFRTFGLRLGIGRFVRGGRDRRRHDRGDREVAVVDRRGGALGQLHVRDVDRVANFQTLQRDGDLGGDVGGVDNDLDLVAGDVQ